MRKIGSVEGQKSAQLFGDYPSSLDIENQVDDQADDSWAIWVYRDDQLDEAREQLSSFLGDPSAPLYRKGQRKVKDQRKAQEVFEKKVAKRQEKAQAAVQDSGNSVGYVTAFVLIVTVGVAIWTGLGLTEWSEYRIPPLQISEYISPTLPEVYSGQVWRLITPVFLHFGFVHLGFNLMAFVYLGQMIERRSGVVWLIALFLVSGVGSNLAQYFVSGPGFGGLSGVDYALFGYVWMKSRFDPFSGFLISDQTVVFALIWLVICFTGMMGPIANIAHLGGLVVGVSWGYFSARFFR